MKRYTFSELLTLIIVGTASVGILTGLGLWTHYLTVNSEEKALRKAMEKVVAEKGEKALFEMAGIPTDQIHYGSELIPLFENETGSWSYTQDEARNIAVYKKCRDSVVQILASKELSDSGQGSGVVISSDGYIVTNRHVIGSGTSFDIIFSDETKATASLVGYDALTDIAVLKTQRIGLSPISFGLTSGLTVGQTVLAIGNPYGYTWSLTSGMVSGLDRMVATTTSASVIPNMIQTDAMINPGNSGGPLLDTNGDMIGLVSSIYSTSGSAQGISFALPAETVKSIASTIIQSGKATRGWMDFLSVELNAQIVSYCNLPVDKGILVSQVVPAGKADKGGIRGGNEKAQYGNSVIYLGGDVIVKINDTPIENYTDYFSALFSTKAGDRINVTVLRGGQYLVLNGVELVEQTEENTQWILR
ncbi:MAG: trypsin-like peptidase domain-containing protein [Spirochaetales bacterium]|nr:trypsin-like peptidase domain-containing protein [Candidatus Physcosoma equi]